MKYPKAIEDSGLDLIRLFLKWPPHGRCTVQQSLDHIFSGEVMDLAAVLRTLSHEQLGKLVVDSLTSGVLVSSAGILAAGAPPASPRGAKRPLQVDGAGNDADDVSAGKPDMVHDESPCNTTATDIAKQKVAGKEGSSNIASGLQDLDDRLCSCRGLCRRSACVKACNLVAAWKKTHPEAIRTRFQICVQPSLPERRFCGGCKCEVTDCGKGRDKSHARSGRWCFTHGKTLVCDRKKCASHRGQQVYGQQWNLQLRLTARLSFLLRDMMPQDMTAAFDFFRRFRDVRQDQGMRREDLMWMVLASA